MLRVNLRLNKNTQGYSKPYKPCFLKWLWVILVLTAIALAINPIYLLSKAYYAQILLQQAWQKTLIYNQSISLEGHYKDNDVHKGNNTKRFPAWSWADGYPIAELTYQPINGDKTSWIVLAGMSGRNMAFAPGWLQSSAQPNTVGNTVISAHNDSHFKVFERLKMSDILLLTSQQGETLRYQVNSIEITNEEDESAYQYTNAKQLTLITCYPFSATATAKSQRLVIKAFAI